ncbi:LysR substrate-binding domain-containing protein, partial [Rubrivirga sp.]|uniref:LysR substrate-binding domain-containing protein n=1 Tax=Rubrivirga sp. TaxID=1885344 RepID=UPI003C759CD0
SYISAARAGLGIVQIPAFDAKDMLQSGELVRLLPDLQAPTMQLSLLYARRRNVPARIEGFHDWITSLLRKPLERGRAQIAERR